MEVGDDSDGLLIPHDSVAIDEPACTDRDLACANCTILYVFFVGRYTHYAVPPGPFKLLLNSSFSTALHHLLHAIVTKVT